MTFLRIVSRSIFLVEHDLFGKPVPTFPDHALVLRARGGGAFSETAVTLQPDTAGDPSTSRMADARAMSVP